MIVYFKPIYIIYLACISPTNLVNRYVPPAPGIIASPVSGRPSTAFSVITLKSQANASSSPPPSANPSITANVGTYTSYNL